MIQPLDAVVLGVVEGLTEYLPVSSTGHLILTAHALGLRGEGVKTFEVVIQFGAIAAVLGLYRQRVGSMWRGVTAQETHGRTLLRNITLSFLPAVVAGLALHRTIKAHLFNTWPVVWALAVGGILMIVADRWLRRTRQPVQRTLDSVTWREALIIGAAQCLALWPGTSRAMVTILAGMLVGLPATAAAEYSFLLALPTLGAATLLDALSNGHALMRDAGAASILCGFVSAAVVAALAVRGFVHYLTRHGLEPFGWYRLAVALLVWLMASGVVNVAGSSEETMARKPETATFAGGCFWCMEPAFEALGGIVSVAAGYTGGTTPHPTYEEVSSGTTDHVEAVQIVYNPAKVAYDQLLHIFWENIDPTQADGQFADHGPQYRTAIFYHTDEQRRLAEASKAALAQSGKFTQPIVTEIVPALPFYPAEEYHQDYAKKNPLRYQLYKTGSGREEFLKKTWKR